MKNIYNDDNFLQYNNIFLKIYIIFCIYNIINGYK